MARKIEGAYLIETPDGLSNMVNKLVNDRRPVAFDIETTGLSPRYSRMVSLAFSQRDGATFVFDMRQQSAHLIGSILERLFEEVLLIGMNIKFDLEFMLEQCSIVASHVYDIMPAEQVLTGLGISEGRKANITFNMSGIANTYGIQVSKEERNWFIDLDEREEWWGAFPAEQIKYMRQDVEILHAIYDAQRAKAEKAKLSNIIDLEMRALLAIVGIETAGVLIDAIGWLETIEQVKAHAQELEAELHEHLDEHILAIRTAKYDELYGPWHDWQLARDAYLATIEKEFKGKKDVTLRISEEEQLEGWGNIKKYLMTIYNATHEQPKKPAVDKTLPSVKSPHQLLAALNHMRLDDGTGPITFTSVREGVLSAFAERFPIIGKLMEFKKLDKLIVAFGDKMVEKVEEKTGRLYPSYHQIGAGTGRMSSYNPNFQQIPSKGVGAELRHHVKATDGKMLVVSDFSNVELRIIAELSRDANLLAAFASKKDVHSMTAQQMFKLDFKGEDPKKWASSHNVVIGTRTLDVNYRTVAKTINFMLLYGGGQKKLAGMLGIDEKQAKELMQQYFNLYSGVKGWIDGQHAKLTDKMKKIEAQRRGEVFGEQGKKIAPVVSSRTIGGRVRKYRIPAAPTVKRGSSALEIEQYEWDKQDYNKKLAGIKRKMVNSPIQGTSADITKQALALWHEEVGYNPDMRLIAVVHDELIVEATESFVEDATKILRSCMDEAMHLYLKRVYVPTAEVVVSDYWQH